MRTGERRERDSLLQVLQIKKRLVTKMSCLACICHYSIPPNLHLYFCFVLFFLSHTCIHSFSPPSPLRLASTLSSLHLPPMPPHYRRTRTCLICCIPRSDRDVDRGTGYDSPVLTLPRRPPFPQHMTHHVI